MSADEFQELKKFATGIEKTNQEVVKKEPKKKNNLKFLFKIFLRKIYTFFISFLKWTYIKTKTILIQLKKWISFKKDLRKIKKNMKLRFKKKDISYKIVETKKQKGNKTIITRKRVPFYFDINSYKSELSNMHGVFYLSEKEKDTKNSEYYYFVKKSIWDFPVQDKKLRNFVLFWQK